MSSIERCIPTDGICMYPLCEQRATYSDGKISTCSGHKRWNGDLGTSLMSEKCEWICPNCGKKAMLQAECPINYAYRRMAGSWTCSNCAGIQVLERYYPEPDCED